MSVFSQQMAYQQWWGYKHLHSTWTSVAIGHVPIVVLELNFRLKVINWFGFDFFLCRLVFTFFFWIVKSSSRTSKRVVWGPCRWKCETAVLGFVPFWVSCERWFCCKTKNTTAHKGSHYPQHPLVIHTLVPTDQLHSMTSQVEGAATGSARQSRDLMKVQPLGRSRRHPCSPPAVFFYFLIEMNNLCCQWANQEIDINFRSI